MHYSGYNGWWCHSVRENTGRGFEGLRSWVWNLAGFSYLTLHSACWILFWQKYMKKIILHKCGWKREECWSDFFIHNYEYSLICYQNWTSDSFLKVSYNVDCESYQWASCTLLHKIYWSLLYFEWIFFFFFGLCLSL